MQPPISAPDLHELVKHLQQSWQSQGDNAKAQAMQAYMKHHFEFLGIATPQRRVLSRPVIDISKTLEVQRLFELLELLWRLPRREYHYLAIDLLAANQRRLSLAELPAILALMQINSWWDSVDGLVAVIDKLALRGPLSAVEQAMDECLKHPNFWLRRAAMLHQKSWKQATNQARLFRYVLHLAPETEFFIRKAIGWALREYAKTEPEAVQEFLLKHGAALSPLSRREAAKHL